MDCRDARGAQPHESPLGKALFRVIRAVLFEETPIPELDALPLAQLRLLWRVHFAAHSTMKDLSESLGVSQSTVTQLADRLVRRGLVERHPDLHDRRIVRLQTSQVGHLLIEQSNAKQRATIEAVWTRLNGQEQAEAMHSLEALGSAAEAVRAEEGRPLAPFPEACDAAIEDAPVEGAAQPVVDLMARRVRGHAPAR